MGRMTLGGCGFMVGIVLATAIMISPGCEYLGGGTELTAGEAAQVQAANTRIQEIDAAIPAARQELARLRAAYMEMAAGEGSASEAGRQMADVINRIDALVQSWADERGRITTALDGLAAAVGPDGSIDFPAVSAAAAPLVSMIPGANVIVPLLPLIGAVLGWLGRNRKVRAQSRELGETLKMSEQLSMGAIGVIDSIETLKQRLPRGTDEGDMVREALRGQPQQSRFLVSAIRGKGFADERMAPILRTAQGELANLRRTPAA